MMTRSQPALSPGITSGGNARHRPVAPMKPSRFVTQSHALSTPIASPRGLFLAATIAVALYWVGRRLSE
jgi:hypothetical protein